MITFVPNTLADAGDVNSNFTDLSTGVGILPGAIKASHLDYQIDSTSISGFDITYQPAEGTSTEMLSLITNNVPTGILLINASCVVNMGNYAPNYRAELQLYVDDSLRQVDEISKTSPDGTYTNDCKLVINWPMTVGSGTHTISLRIESYASGNPVYSWPRLNYFLIEG